jgi:hypothetical protein
MLSLDKELPGELLQFSANRDGNGAAAGKHYIRGYSFSVSLD